MSRLLASSLEFDSSASANTSKLFIVGAASRQIFQTLLPWYISRSKQEAHLSLNDLSLLHDNCQTFQFITGLAIHIQSVEQIPEFLNIIRRLAKYLKSFTLGLDRAFVSMKNRDLCNLILEMIHLESLHVLVDDSSSSPHQNLWWTHFFVEPFTISLKLLIVVFMGLAVYSCRCRVHAGANLNTLPTTSN